MTAAFETFFSEIAAAIGADAINRSEETLRRYAENTMPGGDRRPAGVVYPASTADVQKIVRSANAHGVPVLYADSLAYTECRMTNAVEAGDHTIVVGLVLGGKAPAPGTQPLIYFRRAYATLRG